MSKYKFEVRDRCKVCQEESGRKYEQKCSMKIKKKKKKTEMIVES